MRNAQWAVAYRVLLTQVNGRALDRMEEKLETIRNDVSERTQRSEVARQVLSLGNLGRWTGQLGTLVPVTDA